MFSHKEIEYFLANIIELDIFLEKILLLPPWELDYSSPIHTLLKVSGPKRHPIQDAK